MSLNIQRSISSFEKRKSAENIPQIRKVGESEKKGVHQKVIWETIVEFPGKKKKAAPVCTPETK